MVQDASEQLGGTARRGGGVQHFRVDQLDVHGEKPFDPRAGGLLVCDDHIDRFQIQDLGEGGAVKLCVVHQQDDLAAF